MRFFTEGEYQDILKKVRTDAVKEYMEDMNQIDFTRSKTIFDLDFKKVPAILSIERVKHNTPDEQTLVTFAVLTDPANDKHSTFIFWCSKEQHNEFVRKWREYVAAQ